MKPHESGESKLYLFMRRVLEGRVTPLQFIVVLGSFSTLVLLYISLHVCFFNISTEIAAANDRVESLMEANVRLMARYNELSAPVRIIPLARELGMRAGVHDEVKRLAFSGEAAANDRAWAKAATDRLFDFAPANDSRSMR